MIYIYLCQGSSFPPCCGGGGGGGGGSCFIYWLAVDNLCQTSKITGVHFHYQL